MPRRVRLRLRPECGPPRQRTGAHRRRGSSWPRSARGVTTFTYAPERMRTLPKSCRRSCGVAQAGRPARRAAEAQTTANRCCWIGASRSLVKIRPDSPARWRLKTVTTSTRHTAPLSNGNTTAANYARCRDRHVGRARRLLAERAAGARCGRRVAGHGCLDRRERDGARGPSSSTTLTGRRCATAPRRARWPQGAGPASPGAHGRRVGGGGGVRVRAVLLDGPAGRDGARADDGEAVHPPLRRRARAGRNSDRGGFPLRRRSRR